MLVSVHLTTFCQAESGWLARAIESILSQTHKEFELICYDDASYDGTAGILQAFAKRDDRVRVIRGAENVNSVSKSLGSCFLARSPHAGAITWMFDDNVLEPDALATLVAEMEQSGADVVYGQTRIMTRGGDSWQIGRRAPEAVATSFDLTSADVPNAGILIRQDLFEKTGWYDPNIIVRRSCDWDLFRRVWREARLIKKVNHICSTEYGELSTSSLRNSFDTSFELMKKYIKLRDIQNIRLDPLSVVYGPADIIPFGEWTKNELIYIYRGFVRYFVSVGNLRKAAEWSQVLIELLGLKDDLLIRNLNHHLADKPALLGAVLAGLFAGRATDQLSAEKLNITSTEAVVTVPPLGFASLVSIFLRGKIREANTPLGKRFWRSAFLAGQFVWRRRPHRAT